MTRSSRFKQRILRDGLGAGALAAAAVALAAVPAGNAARADSGPVAIDITDPERSLYPIAIPEGVDSDPALSELVAETARFNMKVSGWFNVLDPDSFLADLEAEGMSIRPRPWEDVGAFGVMKHRAVRSGDRVQLDFRLFEVEEGSSPVLERTYTGDVNDARSFVHDWSNEVVEYFTGEPGFFGARLAFTANSRHAKRILTMDHDGHNIRPVTRNRHLNILPAFSPGGDRVAFTSYMHNNPDLFVAPAGGGRPHRLSSHRGMNTGASWSPDGDRIAVTLSRSGSQDIYLIDAQSGDIVSQLTRGPHINTSPAWSPDGSEIAFVSGREGGPQIFVMDADGSNQRRVSRTGNYNSSPAWSPEPGVRMLAYTSRVDGPFDIVTQDLDSGERVRITRGEGNNEEPSFTPNGRAIAFGSDRPGEPGIYITNADGTGPQVRIWSGAGTSPTWGPMPD